jgi:hypothetical protein
MTCRLSSVNEGVAQLCEMWSTRHDPTRYDEIKETLGTYWTAETIQEFWTGKGFFRPDEGQMHSYRLALVLTRKLTPDLTRFRAFLREVDATDAGTAALQQHYQPPRASSSRNTSGKGSGSRSPLYRQEMKAQLTTSGQTPSRTSGRSLISAADPSVSYCEKLRELENPKR